MLIMIGRTGACVARLCVVVVVVERERERRERVRDAC